jgi:hypothetical protein
VLLALWLAVACGLVLPIAFFSGGGAGFYAALAGAGVVYVASMGAMLLGDIFSRPGEAFVGVLLGMVARMSFSLAACVIALLDGGPLVHAGFVYFVLGFYLAALPADTLLAVLKIESSPGA